MKQVASALRKEKKIDFVLCAYNEIATPSFPDAVEILVKKGAQSIFVVPYFLQAGRHVKRDIPALAQSLRKKYLGRVKIILCAYLGYDARVVEIVKNRLKRM